MKQFLLIVLFVFGVQSTSLGPYHGYEQPEWELLPDGQPEDHSYQVRRYPEATWVSTNVSGMNFDEVGKIAFWRLFAYINGENEPKTKIPMTVPVTTVFHGQPCPYCNATFTMSFYLPKEYESNPPNPTNPMVQLEFREEMDVYVKTFSWWAKEKDWKKQVGKLYANLLSREINDEDPSKFMSVGYDGPMRFLYRRNEVWLIKTSN